VLQLTEEAIAPTVEEKAENRLVVPCPIVDVENKKEKFRMKWKRVDRPESGCKACGKEESGAKSRDAEKQSSLGSEEGREGERMAC
jgi:hypothetical protein